MMTHTIALENLHLPGTASTPAVDFLFDTHQLTLTGESYPENAAAFYSPLLARVQEYLDARLAALAQEEAPAATEVHVSLAYFNSSSTKMLFSLFHLLHQAAERRLPVALHWYHDQDDDIAAEFGQELHIDFPVLDFHSHPQE